MLCYLLLIWFLDLLFILLYPPGGWSPWSVPGLFTLWLLIGVGPWQDRRRQWSRELEVFITPAPSPIPHFWHSCGSNCVYNWLLLGGYSIFQGSQLLLGSGKTISSLHTCKPSRCMISRQLLVNRCFTIFAGHLNAAPISITSPLLNSFQLTPRLCPEFAAQILTNTTGVFLFCPSK